MKFPFLFKSPESAAAPKTTLSPDGAEEPEFSTKGLRASARFFFEPGRTKSILEEAKSRPKTAAAAAVLEIDSTDPFLDFRASMGEMAEAHALKDWDDLENLLSCYLRVNRKNNHGYIIGAFVDLVFHLVASEQVPESSVGGASTTSAAAVSSSLTSTAETQECSDFTSPLYSFSSYSLSNSDEKDIGGSYAASFLSSAPPPCACSSRV